jgi:hypothetical protein
MFHTGGKDDEHTGRPRTFRTELKIQEVATLVRANRSQTVDEMAAAAAAAAGISHGTCHKILSADLNMLVLPSTVFHAS